MSVKSAEICAMSALLNCYVYMRNPMIKQSLKYFLIGLLAWPILAEVIGFISPLWSVFVLGDTTGETGLILLEISRPYLALVSVVFAYSFYLISRVSESTVKKRLCELLGLVYVCVSIYGFFPEDDVTYTLLSSIHYLAELSMLFIGAMLIYKNIQEIHNKPLQ